MYGLNVILPWFEFYGVIHVMEEAQKMRLTNVWLECDSTLVSVAFQ